MDAEYETTVPVRYVDLDTAGHVNNAVYVTYMEEARVDYFADVVGVDVMDTPGVVARVEVDFERPVRSREPVAVAVRTTDLGRSSLTTEYELRQDDGVVATGRTVQVAVEEASGDPRPLPEEWRERIRAFES